ncbi:DUF736 family protein [Sinorhizobium mexicanum]|nr:DUF736 family protein [Sinorhizobium mexicanum]
MATSVTFTGNPQREGSHRPHRKSLGQGPALPHLRRRRRTGPALQKRSEQDRDYLSVKLDDPSFPAPIYATLTEVEGEDGFQLICSRPNRD